jgi:hypothetical protein
MSEKESIDKAIKMAHELNARIAKAPEQRRKIIQEFYIEKSNTGNNDEAHLALLYKSLAAGQGDSDVKVPPWFAKAGFTSGAVTLAFLMLLIVASIFGHSVPAESRFLVSLVFSLGASLAVAFLGGEIAATGSIPVLADHPIAFSATGGVATLVILLAALHYLYGG